jgi:hypothetical protein
MHHHDCDHMYSIFPMSYACQTHFSTDDEAYSYGYGMDVLMLLCTMISSRFRSDTSNENKLPLAVNGLERPVPRSISTIPSSYHYQQSGSPSVNNEEYTI